MPMVLNYPVVLFVELPAGIENARVCVVEIGRLLSIYLPFSAIFNAFLGWTKSLSDITAFICLVIASIPKQKLKGKA